MKHSTSVANAQYVADQLRRVSGIIATPNCAHDAVRVKRAWLFGSTAKGKENPNDTDIIIEYVLIGKPKWSGRNGKVSGHFRINRDSYRRFGWSHPEDSLNEARRFLKGRKKMIRVHQWEIDKDVADGRVMIYPVNDLKSISF